MKPLIIAATLFTSFGANAAALPRSAHPRQGIADADLATLAKVSQVDARP
jgi:hypothetical protein